MPANVQSIIREISYYLQSNGYDNRMWYIGLSVDPLESMITKHGVDEEKDLWIYRECLTPDDAIFVRGQLMKTLKCDGEERNPENGEKYVYVYKKNSRTIEREGN